MKLTTRLAVVLAVLVAALCGASGAYAESVEVTEEGGGHCNPCTTHVVSTSSMVLDVHIFGIEFTDSVCNMELDAVVNEDGTGEFINHSLTGAGCNRVACSSAIPVVWPFVILGVAVIAAVVVVVLRPTICFKPAGGGDEINCTVDFDVNYATHQIGFSASGSPCSGSGESPAELSGTMITEGEEVEITAEE
jgi:hypothetical protein